MTIPDPVTTPETEPPRPLSRRRMLAGLVSTIAVSSAAGGVAGSAATVAVLNRTALTPQPDAPPLVDRSAGAASAPAGGLTALYRQVAPSVVSVRTAAAARSRQAQPPTPAPPGSPDTPLLPRGEGSGFVVDAQGHILTNYHVIDGATSVTLALYDGGRVTAAVVGSDPASDLALLKATIPDGHASAARLGDSDLVEPGDLAIAIGAPFGLEYTITAGIVSAVNRDFGTAAGRPMRGLIQTDAPINPGNSGGPLFNGSGEVIGITTSIESPVRGSVGVGFAIPINAARRLLPQLIAGQTIEHSWLGISGVALSPDIAAEAGLPATMTEGVLIAGIQPDSPAARAGLRGGQAAGAGATPRGGDVILAVDGRPIRRVQDVGAYLDTKRPGDTVTLTIWRDGTHQDVRATLAAWPRSTA